MAAKLYAMRMCRDEQHLGDDFIKRTIILFVALLIATMSFGTGAVSASSATGVKVTSTTVTAHGWNSCSKGWFKTGGTFENYCPICHRHGTLRFNPKGTAEGEWTCSACDSDYCLCGRCKASGSGIYLVRATSNGVAAKKSPSQQQNTNTGTNTGTSTTDTGTTLGSIIGQINEPWSVF